LLSSELKVCSRWLPGYIELTLNWGNGSKAVLSTPINPLIKWVLAKKQKTKNKI